MTGFPSHVLKPSHKVLSLFSAAFGGKQDVKFIHEAGVKTCLMVDINAASLKLMDYPYEKICADCFEMIDRIYERKEKFNVVVSDHWTGQDTKIHGEYFEKLRSIAPILILGICQTHINTQPSLPPGLYYKRGGYNGGVFWRLIQRQ